MLTPEEQLNFTNEQNRFMRSCGIRIKELDTAHCVSELTVGPDSVNTQGTVHGGLLYTISDCTASALARANAGTTVTLGGDFRYHANVKGGVLRCEAVPVRVGKTIMVFRAEVRSEGKLLAEGTFTCFHKA